MESIVNRKYRHYKTGQFYEVIGIARHSETQEEMIVYRGLYRCTKFGNNPWWVRPKKMFFEQVTCNGHCVPRNLKSRQCPLISRPCLTASSSAIKERPSMARTLLMNEIKTNSNVKRSNPPNERERTSLATSPNLLLAAPKPIIQLNSSTINRIEQEPPSPK